MGSDLMPIAFTGLLTATAALVGWYAGQRSGYAEGFEDGLDMAADDLMPDPERTVQPADGTGAQEPVGGDMDPTRGQGR